MDRNILCLQMVNVMSRVVNVMTGRQYHEKMKLILLKMLCPLLKNVMSSSDPSSGKMLLCLRVITLYWNMVSPDRRKDTVALSNCLS